MLDAATFREAMATARKSVSKSELARYLSFKKELSGGVGPKEAARAPDAAAAEHQADEDDELYD